MEYQKISNTNLIFSKIILGCEPLGGIDWGSVDIKKVRAGVKSALGLGVNTFDVADVYGLGRAEKELSLALGKAIKKVNIITKFGVSWVKLGKNKRAETFIDNSPEHLRNSVEQSLRRLKIDSIALYLVHWPDYKTPITEVIEELEKLKKVGKIKYFGVSNFPLSLLKEAFVSGRISAIENQYSLICRQAESDILPFAVKNKISVLVYGALAQGLLSGKYSKQYKFGPDDRRCRLKHFLQGKLKYYSGCMDKLNGLKAKYGKTSSQLAIRWVLDSRFVDCAIVGAKNREQIESNIGSLGWSLEKADRLFMSQLFLDNRIR